MSPIELSWTAKKGDFSSDILVKFSPRQVVVKSRDTKSKKAGAQTSLIQDIEVLEVANSHLMCTGAPAHNLLIHQIPPQTYQLFSIYFKCISWTLVFKAIPYFCLLLIPSVEPKMAQNIKVSNMFLKTFFPESPRRVRPTWSLSID